MALKKSDSSYRLDVWSTPHWLRLPQFVNEVVRVEMEVRENDAAAIVNHREPGCSSGAVVFHEGGKLRAGRWLVMTEGDRKLVL